MTSLTYKQEIQNTFLDVRKCSFYEKTHARVNLHEISNSFSNESAGLREKLNQKVEIIDLISEKLEKITWLDQIDEEGLMVLNDLISTTRDLYISFIRYYVLVHEFDQMHVAKKELESFKHAVDYLKETCDDLESVFFYLPNDPEFIQVTQKLAGL